MWLAIQQRNEPNASPGWLMKVDRQTGKVLGYVDAPGVHGMEALANGELLMGRGPNEAPLWFRLPH